METTLEPKAYTKPTQLEMNTWLSKTRVGFDATDTKSIVFDLNYNIYIYTKEPHQEWADAKLYAQGCERWNMLNKYNSLP